MRRTAMIGIALVAALGCGDASAGSQYGELVECDRVNDNPLNLISNETGHAVFPVGETWCLTTCVVSSTVDGVEQEEDLGCNSFEYTPPLDLQEPDQVTVVCYERWNFDQPQVERELENYAKQGTCPAGAP